MSQLEIFFKKIHSTIRLPEKEASELLKKQLTMNPKSPHLPKLQVDLQNQSEQTISKFVQDQQFFGGDWARFESLIVSYLKFVRNFDPWSILKSIDLMINVVDELASSLNKQQHYKYLFGTLVDYVILLHPLVKLVDKKLLIIKKRNSYYPRLTQMSTILQKAFNNIRNQRDPTGQISRDQQLVLFLLGIKTCYIYFNINHLLRCNDIFSNMNVLNLDAKIIPKSQLIQYRFLLGKFNFIQNNFMTAFVQLNWCLNNAYINNTNHRTKNMELILKYLIPSSLIVGKIPNLNILNQLLSSQEAHPLIELYRPLISTLKKGNVFEFHKYLFDNESYFLKMNVLLPLLQRLRILLFRNLVRKLALIEPPVNNSLRFSSIKTALFVSISPNQNAYFQNNYSYLIVTNESQIDDSFVENLMISLIDQNLIKGKLVNDNHRIIVSKADTFPEIPTIYSTKFAVDSSFDWLDQ
ncbi:TREX-2 complex component [Komagataella phaffii CBS 7435]|uniref:Nuclear pore-associated protein, forms a complex with Sac3p n=2 Tax=Komagataella phaffii TaxID=460519 RepID=C4QWH3_KOMPG|nr:Nuclear pore-associated protein, forms a complex with Sac3p [Komagataella phaffii GS115]AOA61611.1 GQ67_02809T0 [Komagataella phaffii]CAH2446273.1 TREX-2 complex component [Komagataella phaffii CBS 7435]AOA65853.1 GQ68_02439T0 [Komagataella phaffii GS115]CAY67596.1 Nuclear pore-associated protein, forms a complex with Sac3p [Komagataella phaffii GS115]CCA36691.1 TREX-2 complex component [Komagataella phaffii CBS 7435]